MRLSSPRYPRPCVALAFWRKPNHDLALSPFSSVISVSLQHWATIQQEGKQSWKKHIPHNQNRKTERSASEKWCSRESIIIWKSWRKTPHTSCSVCASQTQESMGELTQSSSHKGLYIRAFHWHCQRLVNHMQIFPRMLLQCTQKELDSLNSLSPWSTRRLQSPSPLGCRGIAALSRRAGHKFSGETGGPQCSYCKEDIDAGTTASQSYNNNQINKIQVLGDSSRPLTLTQNCQAPT